MNDIGVKFTLGQEKELTAYIWEKHSPSQCQGFIDGFNTGVDIVFGFLEFEGKQKKELRGGVIMYDVKGCHKYLNHLQLFDYYTKNR